MADAAGRCGWNTGTASRGPSRCGKPAKATTDHPTTDNGHVCGIHARKAERNWMAPPGVTYTVTPLLEGQP